MLTVVNSFVYYIPIFHNLAIFYSPDYDSPNIDLFTGSGHTHKVTLMSTSQRITHRHIIKKFMVEKTFFLPKDQLSFQPRTKATPKN